MPRPVKLKLKGIIPMDLKLYLAMKNEFKLRTKGETGKLFKNQSTEQLEQLISDYEKEIALYMASKTINHISKFERCVSV